MKTNKICVTTVGLTLALLAMPTLAQAALPIIYPTGVDNNGGLLSLSAADPHYINLASALPTTVLANQNTSFWVQSSASRWVSFDRDGILGTSAYTFRQKFNLSSADLLNNLTLTGSFAGMSSVKAYLNGALIGFSTGPTQYSTFTANAGFAQANDLDFVVTTGGPMNQAALNVFEPYMTSSPGNPSAPEPGTLALIAFGISGAVVTRRRKVMVSR